MPARVGNDVCMGSELLIQATGNVPDATAPFEEFGPFGFCRSWAFDRIEQVIAISSEGTRNDPANFPGGHGASPNGNAFPPHMQRAFGRVGVGRRFDGFADLTDRPIMLYADGTCEYVPGGGNTTTVNDSVSSGVNATKARNHWNRAGPILWVVTAARVGGGGPFGNPTIPRYRFPQPSQAVIDAYNGGNAGPWRAFLNAFYLGLGPEKLPNGGGALSLPETVRLGSFFGVYACTNGQSVGLSGMLQLEEATPGGTARVLVVERERWFKARAFAGYEQANPPGQDFFSQIANAELRQDFTDAIGWLLDGDIST